MRDLKTIARPWCPWTLRYAYRKLRNLRRDLAEARRFVSHANARAGRLRRLHLVWRCYRISYAVDCQHSEGEILRVMDAVLAYAGSEPSVIVEAGAYKGGSTAKLSLAASLSDRLLFVFDSFEGMPQHTENHGKNIFGRAAAFPAGSYRGSVEEVTAAVSRFGNLEVCRFVKGWFDDTMPRFHEAVAVAYLDVDLRSSTETCLTYLYPLLVPKGKMFSQDGHLPLILELLTDGAFWTRRVGAVGAPQLVGAGHSKLIEIPREELRAVAALAH